MIKAVFFDIDGTLVSLKTKIYSASTKEALERLRANGVQLFIATGRSRFEIAEEGLLDGLRFDGFLTNNGQAVYDAEWKPIYTLPIASCDAEAVVRYAEERSLPCWVVGEAGSLLNRYDSRVREAMEAIHTRMPRLGDIWTALEKPVYKIVFFLTAEEMRTGPLPLAPHCRTTQWYEVGHDLISAGGGKQNAMREIIARIGVDCTETMAFGDSENDLEMLRFAQIGMAMGNGTAAAKSAADYVTDDCDENGIWNALRRFALI